MTPKPRWLGNVVIWFGEDDPRHADAVHATSSPTWLKVMNASIQWYPQTRRTLTRTLIRAA
jgi:hypothetical protein